MVEDILPLKEVVVESERDQSSQAITVTDSVNLSLSVFMCDTLERNNSNILSSLLLSSDLKGNIENPANYFSDDANASSAVDNLMLTHGWSRFIWTDIEKQSMPIEFLPELRGHVLTGRIKNQLTGIPLSGIATLLSYPDKTVQLYGTYADTNGYFLLDAKHFSGKKKLIICTSQPDSLVQIELNSPYATDFSSYRLPAINLSTKEEIPLTIRSISMQVEEAYKLKGKDIARARTDSTTFYGKPSEQYLLDDYTRFPIMEEVIREYVKGVRLRKRDGKFIFRVNNGLVNTVFDNDPLIMLDGVPLANTDRIMSMDPLRIKQIDVMTTKYYLGRLSFNGIVSFRTYDGDLGGFQQDPKKFTIDYEGLQAQKEFFSPKYETMAKKVSRLPDARLLLYWSPTFTISNNEKELEFFSSDQPGVYKAVIQGISQNGKPVFEQCSFTVKPK